MFKTLSTAGSELLAKGYDPNITPSFEAPWIKNFLTTFAGQVVGTVLICLVIGLVVAAVVWGFGKFTGSAGAASGGLGAVLVILICAAIAGSASGAILWITGFKLFG